MAGTKTPLIIVVYPPVTEWTEEIEKWTKAGHTVVQVASGNIPPVFDLVLGDKCWRMDERHRKYAELAIKSTQARKKGKK
jgi:hypothetical protein